MLKIEGIKIILITAHKNQFVVICYGARIASLWVYVIRLHRKCRQNTDIIFRSVPEIKVFQWRRGLLRWAGWPSSWPMCHLQNCNCSLRRPAGRWGRQSRKGWRGPLPRRGRWLPYWKNIMNTWLLFTSVRIFKSMFSWN